MADDFAGEEVENDAKIYPVIVDFEVCNIADPNLVRMVGSELAFKQVLFFILLMFLILLFRVGADALQPQLLHDCRNAFGSDTNTAFGQSDTNLFSAESLGTIIKDLLYQSHKFDLRFLTLAVDSTTENIVVKGSAGNIQCFA